MRNLITLMILVVSISLTAQKANINNHRFYVEYATLPDHKVDYDYRTYSLAVSGKYKFDKESIFNSLNLRGWEFMEVGGNVEVQLSMSDFVRGNATKETRVVEKKNKDGKVTGRTTYYKYVSTNTGLATLKIYGPENAFEPLKRSKKNSKRDKKAKAKEAAKANNPFLQKSAADDSETVMTKELVATFDLSQYYNVEGSEFTSAKKAYNDYKSKANLAYSTSLASYSDDVVSRVNTSLNQTYGYNRKRDYAKFKKLKSKKHPEYAMFKNAEDALKEIFSNKRFNQSYEEVTNGLAPLITYFESTIEKYSKDDKHQKRLKAASMYNLAQIYYYTDQPDKVIEIGQQYLSWGHDKKDGEKFIEKAKQLDHLLSFHDVPGRYFETDEDANSVSSEDESIDMTGGN